MGKLKHFVGLVPLILMILAARVAGLSWFDIAPLLIGSVLGYGMGWINGSNYTARWVALDELKRLRLRRATRIEGVYVSTSWGIALGALIATALRGRLW